ncbi:MAG: hypothetical protein M4579_006901 [Chaenotheca gracillima]|nr:MAG: hypothetical protein M4579_006901 [Chaenotheca gracillima]
MSKRGIELPEDEPRPLKSGERPQTANGGEDEVGQFEDEFEDEYESEDEILEAGVDGRPDDEREAEEAEDQKNAMDVDQQTFIPGRSKLQAGETLSPDASTYEMLHTLSTTWPCLSFDILADDLGDWRSNYPATAYAVTGTQASAGREKENEIMALKLSGLSRMQRNPELESDSDDDDSGDDDEDAEPILESRSIPINTTINRIRAHQMPRINSSIPPTTLTASMAESGNVLVHDITPHLTSFDTPGTTITPQQNRPVSTLRMHRSVEGYAVDWSPLVPQGKLLTGDNEGNIFVTSQSEAGGWTTDTRPFTNHEGSVEELQWSPSERNVFASCSSDGTIKIWDVRSKSHKPALSVAVSASGADVNVMSWSRQTAHLLASGADDGVWGVWDLRQWKPPPANKGTASAAVVENPAKTSVASFSFHKEPITSIEWHPREDSVVAVAAADSTLTLWDLAVELDDEEVNGQNTGTQEDVPPQLLFVHYMDNVKECHWHPQMPGAVMATGGEGFGVFKTISV